MFVETSAEVACSSGEVKNLSVVENDVLMRKWVPHWERFVGESIYQVAVVP